MDLSKVRKTLNLSFEIKGLIMSVIVGVEGLNLFLTCLCVWQRNIVKMADLQAQNYVG